MLFWPPLDLDASALADLEGVAGEEGTPQRSVVQMLQALLTVRTLVSHVLMRACMCVWACMCRVHACVAGDCVAYPWHTCWLCALRKGIVSYKGRDMFSTTSWHVAVAIALLSQLRCC